MYFLGEEGGKRRYPCSSDPKFWQTDQEGRMKQGPGTSTLRGVSFSRKAELLQGHLGGGSSKQKQNEKKKTHPKILCRK